MGMPLLILVSREGGTRIREMRRIFWSDWAEYARAGGLGRNGTRNLHTSSHIHKPFSTHVQIPLLQPNPYRQHSNPLESTPLLPFRGKRMMRPTSFLVHDVCSRYGTRGYEDDEGSYQVEVGY